MKPRYLVLALGLLLCMAFPGAMAVPAPVVVSIDGAVDSSATTFAYQNNLVMLDNGTLVCGYIDTGDALAVKYSEDDGVTWSAAMHPDNLTARTESEVCMIYNDTSESVNIVYTSTNVTGHTRVRQDILYTDTWTFAGFINITGGLYNESQPYITRATIDGRMIAVWIMQMPPGSTWSLMISMSDDDGDTWAEECDIIETGGHNQSWPCLAMDSNDTLHITWSQENDTGEWDYYYSRCEYPWLVFSDPVQICEKTSTDQTEGKVVILGPLTIPDVGTGCAKGFFWNEDGLDRLVEFTLGFAEENTTSNSSTDLSVNGDYVTASANASGFRAIWTDLSDEHLHQSFIAVDWAQLWELDPEEWEDWEDAIADLTAIIDYAIDEEIVIDIEYDIYYDHHASLLWYYADGLNPMDKMVFTHAASTHVVYYDFDDEFIVSDTEWVVNLTNSMIALMAPILALAIVMSVFKGLGKSFKKL